jgi:hypothetical protein
MAGTKAGKKAGKGGSKEEPGPQGSRKERIARLRGQIEEKLQVKDMKVTLADFIRLTQLERELEQEEQPREIIITWKDPSAKHAESI